MGDATILRLVRLLRLARMTRVAKLLRAFPEVLIMIKGRGERTLEGKFAWTTWNAIKLLESSWKWKAKAFSTSMMIRVISGIRQAHPIQKFQWQGRVLIDMDGYCRSLT